MSSMFIRNMKSVSFETELARTTTTGKNGKKLAKRASEQMQLSAKNEMQRQYSGLLRRIGAVLKDPAAHGLGGTAGGSMRVRLRDGRGQFMSVTTPSYVPLTQEYVQRAGKFGLKSRQFWNKSQGNSPREVGLGDRDVSLATAYQMTVNGRDRVYVRANQIRERKTSGGATRYTQRLRFTFSTLPEPLNTIIVDSFISGKLHDPLQNGHNYQRNGIGVIAYPEHFRPLLSVISVQFSERSSHGLKRAVARLDK